MSCSSRVCRRVFDPSRMGLRRHALGMLLLLIWCLSLWICSSADAASVSLFFWMCFGFLGRLSRFCPFRMRDLRSRVLLSQWFCSSIDAAYVSSCSVDACCSNWGLT